MAQYYLIETSDHLNWEVKKNNEKLTDGLTLIQAVQYVGRIIEPWDTCTDVYLGAKGKPFSIHMSYLNFINRPAMRW